MRAPSLAVLLLAACSSPAAYQTLQQTRLAECERLPPGEYRSCVQKLDSRSYEQYRSERERLQKP